MKNTGRKHKKMSGWRIVFLILGILLLAVLLGALAFAATLYVKYRTASYEYQEPVVREEEYVMPEYPEVTPIPEGVDIEDLYLETAEEIPETDAAPKPTGESEQSGEVPEQVEQPEEQPTQTEEQPTQTEEQPTQTEEQPTQTEEQPTQTEKAEPSSEQLTQPSQPQWTGGALPQTVNDSDRTNTVANNPNASFANSANAVSVYGSIPIYQVNRKNADIQNILVLGTDSRDVTLDRGRSDVMIVVSYNHKTGSVKLTSLLRDSFVPIEGHDWNRLNTAYFYGGVGLTVNTINQIYGLDIQEFIVIDFNGAMDFIDYIGGVDVYLTQAEVNYYGWTDMAEGMNHLDKERALTHMRNRKLDSDFGRTRRQRDVIAAVLKAVTQKPLTELYEITDYAFSLIKTNISALSMASLAASVLGNASKLNIETQNVPYSDTYQNVMYGKLGAVLSYDIGVAAGRIQNFIYQ